MAVERRWTAGLHPEGRSTAEDGDSRASCLARKAWHTPGKKVGEAVAGHRPDSARPAKREAARGFVGKSAENDAGIRRHLDAVGFARLTGLLPLSNRRSEPDLLTRANARINLTSGRRACGRTKIPPTAAKAQEDETTLRDGVRAKPRSGRPPRSGRAD